MHANSLRTWNQIVLPTLTASQMAVYRAIEVLGEANTQEIAAFLGVELHKISGRFGEMKRKGWIDDRQSGGRTVWKSKSEPRQMKLI